MQSLIRLLTRRSLDAARFDLIMALTIGVMAVFIAAAPVLGVDPTSTPTATPAATSVLTGSPAATSPAASPAASAPCPLPDTTPTPAPGTSPLPHNLCPAVLKASDPISILAWIFTPIFQAIFMAMALLYNVVGDIGVAIVVLTVLLRLLLVPVFRAQIVSQRRMQMLQPELRAIQTKYKGQRSKISEEQMRLY
ncbi:MAG: YidC/Oxa1 family membrane protein insertase, partial [Candidatus Limnocylindrales bacterium]